VKRFAICKYETALQMPITGASANMTDKGEPIMTTKETIQGYFNSLNRKQGGNHFWQMTWCLPPLPAGQKHHGSPRTSRQQNVLTQAISME